MLHEALPTLLFATSFNRVCFYLGAWLPPDFTVNVNAENNMYIFLSDLIGEYGNIYEWISLLLRGVTKHRSVGRQMDCITGTEHSVKRSDRTNVDSLVSLV